MSLWKQKAEQRANAEALEAAAAEKAKTPEQRAEEARKLREWETARVWCEATAEHGPSGRRYRQEEPKKKVHPTVDLNKDFPPLGK